MKKTFLFAGFASIAMACNTNTNNKTNKDDSASHATHKDTNTRTNDMSQVNPVTQTMEKMMHEMHGAKSTGNNDLDFATMMLEHHKGAVAMSTVALEKGNDAELKAFAQKVIIDQDKEIQFMQEFISKSPKTPSSNSANFQKALNGSMMAMMNDHTTIYNDINKDFAAQMIPHHQSAVDMAEAYLQHGKEPRLTKLSQDIISSQGKEINWLKDWLIKNAKQ